MQLNWLNRRGCARPADELLRSVISLATLLRFDGFLIALEIVVKMHHSDTEIMAL